MFCSLSLCYILCVYLFLCCKYNYIIVIIKIYLSKNDIARAPIHFIGLRIVTAGEVAMTI